MRNRQVVCVSFLLFLLLAISSSPKSAWADLFINFIAVNASETQSEDIEVKYNLPQEIEPADVLDTGPLKVEYDVDKKTYYVRGTARFGPKESKTFKIRVKDVFRITEEEVNVLKKQLQENLTLLKDTESEATAKIAKEKLDAELDFILAQQNNYSDNVERRIEEYRAFVNELEKIRTSAYDIGYLEHESKAIAEADDVKATVKFMIQVTNPDKEKNKKIQHKHYLPQEVRAGDVVDKKGFEVRFDDKKNLAFLTKEEDFKPGEMKKIEIVIKDVWKFPMAKVDDVDKRVKLAMQELKGSIYDKSAQYLAGLIDGKLNQIREWQNLTLNAENHIGRYRLNTDRYEKAREDC